MAAISGVVSSSSREVPYAPASVSGSDVGTARAYNNASATISFTLPVHDGGLPVTGYAVTSSPGGLTASGASSPLTITGLSSSTSYTYSITATNAIGTGPSITSGSVFATTIPQPVTIGTATATGGAGTVSIGFTPNGTGGKTVTYTATSSPGGFTGSSSGSPVSVSGLTDGTAYTFTVVASNANGSAAASAASNSATPYTYVAPVPTNYPPGFVSIPVATASGNSVTSTSGSWAYGDATSFIYKLYIGQSAAGTFVTSSGQVTSTSYTFTGLSYSTNYYVLVEAYNSYGGNSALSQTTTTGPAPVVVNPPGSMAGLVSGSWNNGVITFTWSAPSGTAPFTYYYSTGSDYVSNGSSTSVQFTADNLPITVYASNSAGSGDTGTIYVSRPPVVTAPGSMSGLISGSYSGGYCYFNWSAPSGTGPFTYYYSFTGGYSYNSTLSPSAYLYAEAASIIVFAQNSAGPGGAGSFFVTAPPAPAPNRWYCRTSAQCGGIGNCSDNGGSTNNQTGSGSGYSIACLYNNTGTYPACQSTADATCTGNLSCCSQGLKYQCSNYDVTNVDSVNYWQCYSVGQCAANSDPAGVRTRCCPPKC